MEGSVVSRGSWDVFLERAICAGFLALGLLLLLVVLLPSIRKGRDEAFKEG